MVTMVPPRSIHVSIVTRETDRMPCVGAGLWTTERACGEIFLPWSALTFPRPTEVHRHVRHPRHTRTAAVAVRPRQQRRGLDRVRAAVDGRGNCATRRRLGRRRAGAVPVAVGRLAA